MHKLPRVGLFGIMLAAVLLSSSAALALPPQANVHAQTNSSTGTSTVTSHQSTTGQANVSSRLMAAQLQACQNRESAIKTIMTRIETRAQNQVTLFSTIATRVENFYTTKGNTLSTYDQLVAAVNTAKTQAQTDFATLQSSSFSCTADSPKGIVSTFQSYLKTEITDLQQYRTAVKNLIVGVASVNGVTISGSNESSATEGGQQ